MPFMIVKQRRESEPPAIFRRRRPWKVHGTAISRIAEVHIWAKFVHNLTPYALGAW